MKIGEFAKKNNVTTKMLRHYDKIGLLKPWKIDYTTGYRSYDDKQSHYLNWIIILKNLDFTLSEIKEILSGPMDSKKIIYELIRKRIMISSAMNEQIQKKIVIDKLIKILEKEGLQMDKQIDLLSIEHESVHEIKKNIPNMEMFLETVNDICALCSESDNIAVLRFDICHFKQVNDDFGFDVGDRAIVACYNIIKTNIEKYLIHSAIGRAYGDEFIVFAKAQKEEIEKTAQSIIRDIKNHDFSDLGCKRQLGFYIGGLMGLRKTVEDIRNMIENSIEVINQARKEGTNSIVIQSYGL